MSCKLHDGRDMPVCRAGSLMARQGVFENALSTFCKGALEALWHARTNFGIDKDTSNCFLAIAAFETEVRMRGSESLCELRVRGTSFFREHDSWKIMREGRFLGKVADKARCTMLTLFHHPICPHSCFVRLVLEEYGLTPKLVEERVWERRDEFLMLNAAGTTPVLVEEGALGVPGAGVIAEYLDETHGAEAAEQRLLPVERGARVEVRRLMSWFNDKFFEETSGQ